MAIRAPDYLTETERDIWKDLVKGSPVQLTKADGPALEILVGLLAKQRARIDLGSNERTTLVKLLQEFRLTPTSRAKGGPAPTPTNEFDL